MDKGRELLQWDEWLLEALRKIKAQKQRPTFARIQNSVRILIEKYLSQKSSIPPIYTGPSNSLLVADQVQRHLYRSVKEGILLRILSKGEAIYKNSKEERERRIDLNAPLPSKLIIKVLNELSETTAATARRTSTKIDDFKGFTLQNLQEYLTHSHVMNYPEDCSMGNAKGELVNNMVRSGLEEEERKGNVILCGQHYKLNDLVSSAELNRIVSVSQPLGSGSMEAVNDKKEGPEKDSILDSTASLNHDQPVTQLVTFKNSLFFNAIQAFEIQTYPLGSK